MPKITHYTITLPAHITAKLQAEHEESKTPRSTLIAQHLEEYYNTAPTAQYEEQIQQLSKEYEAKIQEHEATIQELKTTLKEQSRHHTAEVHEIRAEVQHAQNKATAKIQQAEAEAANKATSQEVIIKGLQGELELARKEIKMLSEKVASDASTINMLKDDKDFFKRQLELVTLRLPAARQGFWSRAFGGSKKEKEGA